MSEQDKVPANDLAAESVILADCIFHNDDIDKVRTVLKAEDFYATANQRIFEAMCDIYDSGKPVDIVTLAGHLRSSGKLSQVGGSKALADLLDNESATAHVETHAKTVAEKALVRRVQRTCQTLAAEAYGGIESVTEWLLAADAKIYTATRNKLLEQSLFTIGEATEEELKNLKERSESKNTLAGITTGFRDLDRQIGGWKRGCKYTIAARPAVGKTSLLLNHAIAAAKAGHGVVVVSLEMPREQLVLRALAQLANVDGKLLDTGRLSGAQWKDILEAAEVLKNLPIVIEDSGSQNPASLRSCVREGFRKLQKIFGDKITLDLVAIDYVQIMNGTDKKGQTRENEVAEISNGNRMLAKAEDCAVLELSQLNRKVEERPDKRPIMSDLRESGSLEQDSFGIIMVYRDDVYKSPDAIPDGTAELIVKKIRQGGSCGVVHVKFDGPTTNFFDTDSLTAEFDDIGQNGYHGF